MNKSPDIYLRELRRSTWHVFLLTMVLLGLTVGCALLGWSRGVISLRSATGSAAFAFAVLLSLCIVAALVQWIRRQRVS